MASRNTELKINEGMVTLVSLLDSTLYYKDKVIGAKEVFSIGKEDADYLIEKQFCEPFTIKGL